MSKKQQKRDVEYLGISARIHAMENRLLNEERMERMIEAKDPAEAAKVLAECGYGELREVTAAGLEEMLAKAQAELFHDLGSAVGNPPLMDVFRCKYDYHNAKVLVKAEALDLNQDRLLMGGGRYDPAKLAENFRQGNQGNCSPLFLRSVARAREMLGATGDPQMADLILDRACYEELALLAKQAESPFLEGYVAICIDSINLRSAVRAMRLEKSADFLQQVLLEGGTVSVQTLAFARREELPAIYQSGPLAAAAEMGAVLAQPGSGALTRFECLCDDAVMEYLGAGRRVPFGEQPIIGYLHAREAETTAIRTILSGRMAGLDGNTIRQRLRRTYG